MYMYMYMHICPGEPPRPRQTPAPLPTPTGVLHATSDIISHNVLIKWFEKVNSPINRQLSNSEQ